MPTKQVSYRNDKAVLVRVYVEKPRKKKSSSIQHHHHHHHHHHIHHTVRQEVVHGNSACKGYDRRSGLLMYSRLLRNSTREGASSTPLLPKWFANNNVLPPTQMTPLKKKKEKHEGRPSWFGNWKLIIPSFLRSWSHGQKKENKKQMHGGFLENGIKKLQVRRGKCFIPKVFSTCTKCA